MIQVTRNIVYYDTILSSLIRAQQCIIHAFDVYSIIESQEGGPHRLRVVICVYGVDNGQITEFSN